ncbi:Na+-dependent transporter [Bacterioplanes sanyensis]|uniref:Na+-dependent transporter n=1 Tax=Bacterioplanes sanyensis TaxID=1249553 RepID=A0A222FFE0_9GAMM|nr:bile acid:sodium symporter family protein [Bacterioplanes sanyensis]ASP37728.1 Na+-dependent transporter [Bacterioplanes sanyensis]
MFEAMTQIGLPIALMLIMAGVGMSLTPADFRRVASEPKGFFLGASCQLLMLPLVAMALIAITGLSGEVAIGLFILALCPGGVTSNLYTYLARGDVGLSVSLTAVLGFITPFTIPLLGAWAISFYGDGGKQFELPLLSTWFKLIVITVVPVLFGMAIRGQWPELAKRLESVLSIFSMLVLGLLVISIAINLGPQLLDFVVQAGPAALLLNVVTMVLGYALGSWLLHRETQARTVCLEVGLQNSTLALLITTGVLQSTEMSIAPSVYSLVMFVTATIFALRLRRRPADVQGCLNVS